MQGQATSIEEKIIIQSKKGSLFTFNLVMLIVMTVGYLLTTSVFVIGNQLAIDSWEDAFAIFQEFYPYVFPYFLVSLIVILAVVNLIITSSKYSLTVTDKRVYGKYGFGKQVNLPFDSISAVSVVKIFKGISVATSSGSIKFLLIANAEDI